MLYFTLLYGLLGRINAYNLWMLLILLLLGKALLTYRNTYLHATPIGIKPIPERNSFLEIWYVFRDNNLCLVLLLFKKEHTGILGPIFFWNLHSDQVLVGKNS